MRGRGAEWVGKPKRVVIVSTALHYGSQQPRFTVVDPDALSRNFDTIRYYRYDARVANPARKQRTKKLLSEAPS